MAGIDSERQIIETYIETNWTATPIAWEEVPYTPVEGTSFISVTVKPGGSVIMSMPSGTRYHGLLIIDVYCPRNQGTKTIRDYVDDVVDLFTDKNISGIIFRDMTLYQDIAGDWLKWSVAFIIQRDSC